MTEADRPAPAPLFNETYYAANYGDYDKQNPPRKSRHYARWIEAHLGTGVPRRIHDVGCGPGLFLARLGHDWEVFGSDPSQYAVGVASRRVPRGTFRVGSATDGAASTDPVFAGPFGVVTAFDVLEHVPDLEAAAAAVRRQLVEGGLFLFVVPVYDGPAGPLVRLLDRDPTHVHKWPRRRWLQWAETHFELVDWGGTIRYLLPVVRWYVHLPAPWLRRYTPAITVICRRRAT